MANAPFDARLSPSPSKRTSVSPALRIGAGTLAARFLEARSQAAAGKVVG